MLYACRDNCFDERICCILDSSGTRDNSGCRRGWSGQLKRTDDVLGRRLDLLYAAFIGVVLLRGREHGRRV